MWLRRLLALVIATTFAVLPGCGDDGDWQTVAIAGIRPAQPPGAIEVVPAAHHSPSCTDVRASVSRDDGSLAVRHETRTTADECTLAGASPAARSVVIDGPSPIDGDTAVVFEAPAEHIEREGAQERRRNVGFIRSLRAGGGISTTAEQVEALLGNPDFLRNWDGAGVPFLDEELDNPEAFALESTGRLVERLMTDAGLGPHLVDRELRSDPGRVVVTVTGDIAADVAAIWSSPTVCAARVGDTCLDEVTTDVLASRVVLDEVDPADLTPAQQCAALQPGTPAFLDADQFWPDTIRVVSGVVARADAQLSGGLVTDPAAIDLLAAAAGDARALAVPRVWVEPAPWRTDHLLAAWSLLEGLAAGCGVELPPIA